jgi:3-deoxy-D-manno-octulosonic-acid transferase
MEDEGNADSAFDIPHSAFDCRMLSYAVYDLLGTVVGLMAVPFLPLLALSRYGRGLGERLGWLPPAVRALRRPVWLHAASVGEVLAAEPLVQQLRRQRPDLAIVLSTTSIAGRETARSRLLVDAVMLLPVDHRWIVGSVLRRLQPRCLIIVETEMWPALIRGAARRAVPCIIVSGRISEGAAARYVWVRQLIRAMLAHVSVCAMQTDADAARIVALGAPLARVRVVGSLKFAREAGAIEGTATMSKIATLLGARPLLVAASTHPGEEQLVLDASAPLWAEQAELLLVIAPRRPERFDEVAQLLTRAGMRHERRSRVHAAVQATTQVLLLDTLGELLDVLPVARGVFVGGTIAPVGGHNVLEPAIFGKPVAFGPHIGNVTAAARALLDGGGAVEVRDAAQLSAEWRRLLTHPQAAVEMGRCGRAVVAARAAVAEQTFDVVRPYLGPVVPPIAS